MYSDLNISILITFSVLLYSKLNIYKLIQTCDKNRLKEYIQQNKSRWDTQTT